MSALGEVLVRWSDDSKSHNYDWVHCAIAGLIWTLDLS